MDSKEDKSQKWDQEEFMKNVHRCFFRHDMAVLEIIDPFKEYIMDHPDKAIPHIKEIYEKGLNAVYGKDRAFVESIAGGPAEHVPGALYNAIGSAYPYLERKQKDEAVGEILGILDGINYAYVQNSHTNMIKEPLLLADITLARPLYWPGIEEGIYHVGKHKTFGDFDEKNIDENGLFNRNVQSDFCVGFALLWNKYSKWGEDYVEIANENFLERLVKGIVAWQFGKSRNQEDPTEEKIQKRIKDLEEAIPKSLHSRIEPLRLEADWIDSSKFA